MGLLSQQCRWTAHHRRTKSESWSELPSGRACSCSATESKAGRGRTGLQLLAPDLHGVLFSEERLAAGVVPVHSRWWLNSSSSGWFGSKGVEGGRKIQVTQCAGSSRYENVFSSPLRCTVFAHVFVYFMLTVCHYAHPDEER